MAFKWRKSLGAIWRPKSTRFETVGLGHDLNTAQFKGEAIQRSALPAAGKPVVVGGVPFVLPAPDARGRTHIDLKPSWLAVRPGRRRR